MERLIGIPIETALNGMPGLKYLRSISLAGLNDIKCQFEYGTDYWAARQEVINRIGAVEQPAGGRDAGPLALEPDRRDRPLRAGGARLHAQPAQGGSGLGARTAAQEVPGVIDVTGFGGTVKQYQVLLDTQLMKRYDVTLQMVDRRDRAVQRQRRRRHPAAGHRSRTTSGPSATWARASTRSIPANADRAYAIEVEKLEDLQDVVVTSHNNMPVYIRQIAKVVDRLPASAGDRGARGRERRGRRHRPDAEVREVAADLERRCRRRSTSSTDGSCCPRECGSSRSTADRPGPRDDPQRAAQHGGRHVAGGRRSSSSSWATSPARGSWR